MSPNLSPQAQQQMAKLRAISDKVQRVHGLVERFATARDPRQAEQQALPLKRAFGRLKLDLLGAGFETLSQLAGSMEIAAGRGRSQRQKTRILREGVGSIRSQIELEQRKIVKEEQRARQAERAEARREAEQDQND